MTGRSIVNLEQGVKLQSAGQFIIIIIFFGGGVFISRI